MVFNINGLVERLRDFNPNRVKHLENQLAKTSNELDKTMQMVEKPQHNVYSREIGIQHMNLPLRIRDIYNVAAFNSVLRTAIHNIKSEIFRQPPVWKARFVRKCSECGHEHMKSVDKCEACGSTSLQEPDINQTARFEEFVQNANKNGQTLKEVLKECERDLEIIDDAYVVLVKSYAVGKDGIMYERVNEIIRGNPERIRIVSNDRGEIGGKWWVCPLHREPKFETEKDPMKRKHGKVYENPGHCEICGRKLYEVHHVSIMGTDASAAAEQYFIEGEIIHGSKYSPSLLYGYSPVVSLWKEASTLLNMANYINEYYKFQRTPKGAIFINTMNPESMYKKWDEINERMRVDPHYIPMIATQGDSNSKNRADFVKFSDTLQEMGYSEGKDELRQRISAFYGVTNILMNDATSSGGSNNEGLQIKVTDRAVETGQNVWNEKFFPKLMKAFSITDWNLVLQPNEETDQMKRIQLETSKAQHAQLMQQMGFKVTLDAQGEFEYSGEAMDLSAQQEEMMGEDEMGEGDPEYDDGMVNPDEEPDDLFMDADDEAEGGQYRELFFDAEEDGRKNKSDSSPITIDGELTKTVPWRRSAANGYRKIEITRRDGERQAVWVKMHSDRELGQKRDGESMDTHELFGEDRDRWNIQRRPSEEIKRDNYSTRWEQEEGVKNKETPLPPEKAKLRTTFQEAHNDVVVNIIGRDADQMKETVEDDPLQGHMAAFNPDTKELNIDSNITTSQMKQVFEKYHDMLRKQDEESK
jgi:hypothetical protein